MAGLDTWWVRPGEATERFYPLILLALGGFTGAIARYWVSVTLPAEFPVGTLVANGLGTFLLAILLYDYRIADHLRPETRLLLGTGFCSSFTTYSTFAAETISLAPELAAANVLLNYGCCIIAVLAGRFVTRWYG